MKRCAFLTLEDPTGYVIDDDLAYQPLQDLGWRVDAVPWSRPGVSWSSYDAVVIRSTWDYAEVPQKFLATLAEIEQSGAPLFNDLQTVRWNLDKTYLRSLAERGVPIVPTAWRQRLRRGELAALFDEAGSEEIVVKPVVGAGAIGAFRLERSTLAPQLAAEVETYYAERALMAQPFLTAITSEGEYSLFYFNGQFSHAIQKIPQPGDFRVQEEHGSQILAAAPDAQLLAAGDRAVTAIGDPPLYARADLVRANDDNDFWLIELELVEPSLYLRMDDQSPQRFAKALDRRVNGNQSGF